MTRLEELKVEINSLRNKLGNYLDSNEDYEKIFSLNIKIDQLIVEYHRLFDRKEAQ
ncbi:hypothetical protein SAMN05660297_00679 [Natronincola peptidivorans]|uniref:Spo0E like sporulation regulatory protein n=1 Tax=Natronincola peptidivorans TaxID=426128 RepID=A0A1H9ZQM1_9FIRM|nr:aspartyl-phosphate phosphatase Spo0E family protein [Natronincola peptidivorans]SES83994.1 hypothetical protein SAMN05660297_00679 [Natronincola peptidivorans]